MTPRDFVYWLQGFLELSGSTALTAKQVTMIKKHMALVLTNVTDDEVKTSASEDEYVPPLSAEEELEALRSDSAKEYGPFGPGRGAPTSPGVEPVPLDLAAIMKELSKQAKKFDPTKHRTFCSAPGCLGGGMRFC